MSRSVHDVLAAHDVRVTRNNILCPAHDDTHPSCRVSDEFVYCFACGWNADAAGLEAKLTNRSVGDVLKEWSDGIPVSTVKLVPARDLVQEIWLHWITESQSVYREAKKHMSPIGSQILGDVAQELLEDVWQALRHPWDGGAPTPYQAEKVVRDAIKELVGLYQCALARDAALPQ